MYSFTSLDIAGYRGSVPNTFIKQEQEAQHLAVIYPGLGYNASMPLLYYPARLLTAQGADVLRVEYKYGRAELGSLPDYERERWLALDASAAWEVALAQRPYRQVTLIGKSLGTLALGRLLTTVGDLPPVRAIWLAPLLRSEHLHAQMIQVRQPSLFVIGTADAQYDAALLESVREATGGEVLVIEGANHSLELEGDVIGSIRVLERIVRAVQAFTGP